MFVSALKLQKWLWTRFVFVQIPVSLTQKALIWLRTLTVKVSVNILYKSEKHKLDVTQITCLQKTVTLNEKTL